MYVLGISAFYHDSAACLLKDGEVVAAVQEERFSREKHDASIPAAAIRSCLEIGGVAAGRDRTGGLEAVVFYDKPILKFHRFLETSFAVAPRGLRQWIKGVPVWLRDKLWIVPQVEEALERCGVGSPAGVYFAEHHESHAASAFYPSPFERAAVLTIDGVGEWATATLGVGEGQRLELLEEIRFPHSLGLLYSAFTYFTGFRVNSGEYKLMGLAPYGEPIYKDLILDVLMDLKEDGSFRLNQRYFGYTNSLTMTNRRFARLFGGPPRKPESPLTRREMDLAASVQAVTEEVVLRMARHARKVTGEHHLCLAGGVALNCVANGRLLREGIFDDLWIQPAAGDAGGALGAALAYWHTGLEKPRAARSGGDGMRGGYLGPSFGDDAIRAVLDSQDAAYRRVEEEDWAREVAVLLRDGAVVGLFQGAMEYGPRALGNRSIVADPRSPQMQRLLNRKIKFRESFRPFAPACLEERASQVFDLDRPSPYMLLVASVRPERRLPTPDEEGLSLSERTALPRSDLPAVTHVDGTARVQTVSRRTNPRFHSLLTAFEEQTGCPVLINTSFNVRGEPIVCTPDDAYRCFMSTEMDYLAIGPYLLERKAQPHWQDRKRWQRAFAPD